MFKKIKRVVKVGVFAIVVAGLGRGAFTATELIAAGYYKVNPTACMEIVADDVMYGILPLTYDVDLKGIVQDDPQTLLIGVVADTADSNDVIRLHIDSPGGLATTMISLTNKMTATRAHTISINEGFAASAAGVLAMTADEIQATPMSVYLFHQGHYQDGSLVPMDNPVAIAVNTWMAKNVFPYMTIPQQIGYVVGQDISIDGPTLAAKIAQTRHSRNEL